MPNKWTEHWILPPDATPEEVDFIGDSLLEIYKQFPDVRDRLLIMACFEMGYPKGFAAKLIGRNPDNVSIRINKIRTVLMGTHKAFVKS